MARTNEGGKSDHSTLILWLTVLSVVAALVGLWFGGPLQDQWARGFQDDDAEQAVDDLLATLVEAGHAPLEEREAVVDRAQSLTTENVSDKVWKRWEVSVDPYVWTALSLDSGDETYETASVGPVEGAPWAVRRAKSGCWRLRGDFKLVRTRGEWKIDELPALRNPCEPEELRATWAGSDPTRGVIGWEGSYQRVDPVKAEYSHRNLLIQYGNTNREWHIRRSFDKGPWPAEGHLPYDGNLFTAWGAVQPVPPDQPDARLSWGALTYQLPAKVQLLRVRLHNGVRTDYERHGRIRRATVEAGSSRVDVFLKDRIGSQRLDCSLGTVDSVRVTITDVWPRAGATPADSDVALSQIDFWGMPDDARIDPPPRGAYAWSGADRADQEEDVLECRDDPPPPELLAGAEATPESVATPSPTPAAVDQTPSSTSTPTPAPTPPGTPPPSVPAAETPAPVPAAPGP